MNNIILMTDSYKISHWKQYPKGTEFVYSYFESRGGEYNNVLFFGLQYILKKYLTGQVVDYGMVEDARKLLRQHFSSEEVFNELGWLHILGNHDGKLPIEIKAVPEGTIVNTQNVLFTIENTCPACFWLPSYLETVLEQVWYPCTVATKSWQQKQAIKKWLTTTGNDSPDFKLHDFGYRGSTSQESAGIGAAAHLVNFKGTDTLAGILLLQQYYHEPTMPGFSIPAMEHGTVTSWGKEHEADAFDNMLEQFPEGLIAVVSDSYDIYNAVGKIWGETLKDKIIHRKGTLIIRPDSGNPIKVLRAVLTTLGEKFGYTMNDKGYKVLPPQIRLIQGDGIDEKTLPLVLHGLAWSGWSLDNIAFGSGGGLLQNVTRDTLMFAYKCSSITVHGEDREVYKEPVTDLRKKSKKGRLALMKVDDGYVTMEGIVTREWNEKTKDQVDQLKTIFRNGELLIDQNFADIRKRAGA